MLMTTTQPPTNLTLEILKFIERLKDQQYRAGREDIIRELRTILKQTSSVPIKTST